MPNWFIAIPVPGYGWYERIPEAPSAVRRFAEVDLHMTVAFLGAVDERRARAAFTISQDWPTGPIDISLGSVQPMGNPRRASALSTVVEPAAPVLEQAIVTARDGMLACAGATPDRRPPFPHVTLARIGRRATKQERRDAIAWAAAIDLGAPAVTLERIALFSWSLDRRASLFRIVADRSLVQDDR